MTRMKQIKYKTIEIFFSPANDVLAQSFNKKPSQTGTAFILFCIAYLPFAQVHDDPQLQLTHVQLRLLHFTLFVA
jgi:hypothetical protein